MSFSFGLNPWLLFPAVLLAALFTWWTYGRSRPLLSVTKRLLLAGLRFVSLTLLLLLLFEPILRMMQKTPKRPVFAVLVDASKSMGLHTQAAQSALNNLKLQDLDATIKAYSFESITKPLGDKALKDVPFSGDRTDFTKALMKVREDLGDQDLGGVLVISDGQYNTGRNPTFLAERYPVPIHAMVLGDSTKSKDIQVRRMVTNEVAYLNTVLPVQVGIRAMGYEGQSVTVTLSDNGRQVATTQVTLGKSGEVLADLAFQPTQTGLRKLVAAVTQRPDELTHANNTYLTTVRVLDNKQRVLLIGGAPSPDFSALQQVLLTDPNLEVSQLVQKSAGQYYNASFPTDLSSYDALILHGYPGPGTTAADVQKIAQAAQTGKPVFFFMGQQTNLNLLRDGLGDVLPMKPTVVRTSFVEAQFTPSGNGAVHPILEISDPQPEVWKQLPPLLYNQSRWELASDARILASPQINGVLLPDPLLVIRSRGKIRTAALLGAGIFRWRSLPQDLDLLKNFLPSLAANTVRWVASRQDDRPVRIRPTRTLYGGGEPVQFTGQIYDENLNPIDRALVQLEIETPDGTQIPATMNALGNGRYFADIGTLPEGTYSFTAAAKLGEQRLGGDGGGFAVGALSLEYQETGGNASLMRALAQRSGGLFMPASEAGSFVQQLTQSGKLKPVFSERETEIEPWRIWWILAAIIALLSVEWFLRKRNGLL